MSAVETVDRRVLAALRPVDAATGLPVRGPLRVEAAGLRLVRNRRGDFVVFAAAGLEAHTRAFAAPPAAPPPGSLAFPLVITDPGGRYLPRRGTLRLPRDPAPGAADSVFVPAAVALFLAPAAAPAVSWAVIRATVRDRATGRRLPWALLRVLRADTDALLAQGLADARGEALVAVPGILITMPAAGNGPVLTTELEVKLVAFFDGTLTPIADAELLDPAGSGQAAADTIPDPDALAAGPARPTQIAARGAAPTATGKLASGRALVADVLVTLA